MQFKFQKIKFEDIFWEPSERIKMWCSLPYPRHKKGCPNTSDCKFYRDIKDELSKHPHLYLAWTEFDLDEHRKKMKLRHPDWSETQLSNLLYWQSSVRKFLLYGIVSKFGTKKGGSYQDLWNYPGPEGAGVNLYRTMKKCTGIKLDLPRNLHTVRVISIVGLKEDVVQTEFEINP